MLLLKVSVLPLSLATLCVAVNHDGVSPVIKPGGISQSTEECSYSSQMDFSVVPGFSFYFERKGTSDIN